MQAGGRGHAPRRRVGTGADQGTGNMGCVAADFGCAVNLGYIGQIAVQRMNRAAIPFADDKACAFQVESGQAAGPDIVGGYGIRGAEIIGHVEYGSHAGHQALKFESSAVWQGAPHRNARSIGKFDRPGPFRLRAILKFFGELP